MNIPGHPQVLVTRPTKIKRLMVEEKWAIISEIRQRVPLHEKPTEEVYCEIGSQLNRSPATIRNVWGEYLSKVHQNPHSLPDMRHRQDTNRGNHHSNVNADAGVGRRNPVN